MPPGFVDEDDEYDIMAEKLGDKETVNLEERDICLEGISFIVADSPGAMGDLVTVDGSRHDIMDEVEDVIVRDGDTVQVLKIETLSSLMYGLAHIRLTRQRMSSYFPSPDINNIQNDRGQYYC